MNLKSRVVGEDYCPPAIRCFWINNTCGHKIHQNKSINWYLTMNLKSRVVGENLVFSRNKMFLNQQHMRTQDSPEQIDNLIPYHEFEITVCRGGLLSSCNKNFIESTIRADTRSAPTVL